jgi:TadE-like protein/PilZ domain
MYAARSLGRMDAVGPWKQWWKSLTAGENRAAVRRRAPAVVAYYWDGAVPAAHQVRDISNTGFFLHTHARWFPGTLIMVTLQRTDGVDDGAERAVSVQSRVVRSDSEGVGFAFVPSAAPRSSGDNYADGADRKLLTRFLADVPSDPSSPDQASPDQANPGHPDLDQPDPSDSGRAVPRQARSEQAQALVEYAFMVPLVFILIMNMVNFGGFFYAWITVANAARAGADYAIRGGASVSAAGSSPPRLATAAQITSFIQADTISLPNSASIVVTVCPNSTNMSISCGAGLPSVPADPEPASFVLTSIDVTYTYVPFIPAGFRFQNLNFFLTLPPTTVHRRALMRTQL